LYSFTLQRSPFNDFVEQNTPSVRLKYFKVHNSLFHGPVDLLVGGYFKSDGDQTSREMLCGARYYANEQDVKLGEIETKFARMMRNSGKGVSKVSDLKTFIEIMSATGLMHGSTLSLVRSFFCPEVLSRVSDSDTYTTQDVVGITITSGTILGLVPDHHVFSSNMVKDAALKSILQDYDYKTTELKRNYFNKIKKHPEFKNLGWIWTDYGPDLIDDKQLTIATYI